MATAGLARRERARALAIAALSRADCQAAPVAAGGRVLLGSAGAAASRAALRDAGVTHILCVARGLGAWFPGEFEHSTVEVDDRPGEDLGAHFAATTAWISAALVASPDNRVLVHCFRGKSRSAAVVAAYLISTTGCSVEDAMTRIRAARPQAQPNLGFCAQLRRFHREVVAVEDEHDREEASHDTPDVAAPRLDECEAATPDTGDTLPYTQRA